MKNGYTETIEEDALCQRPVPTDAQVAAEEASNALRGLIKKMPTWDDFLGVQQMVSEMNDTVQTCTYNISTMQGVSIPTVVSQLTNDTGFITTAALSGFATTSSVTSAISSALSGYATTANVSSSITTALTNYATTASVTSAITTATTGLATSSSVNTAVATKLTTPTGNAATQYLGGDGSIQNFPAIPSVARTTSIDTIALVGTGATGAQVHATKDSSVKYCVSTSTTSTIGGPATSIVALKICATNDATEANWTTVGTFESDQTITLALALNSVQIVKGQIVADVPAGWYRKLVNSGSGTHAEAFVSGQKTIYG